MWVKKVFLKGNNAVKNKQAKSTYRLNSGLTSIKMN